VLRPHNFWTSSNPVDVGWRAARTRPPCQAMKVSHLHPNEQRLVAHHHCSYRPMRVGAGDFSY
jgi:hypothetical protein